MIVFILFAILLIALTLAALALPLLRSRSSAQADRDHQNVQIARERIADLEAELAEGVLSPTEFAQAREEVESALLIDMDQRDAGEGVSAQDPGRGTFAALAVAVPLFAVLMYLQLGEPKWVTGEAMVAQTPAGTGNDSGQMPSVEEMISRLAKRLSENPEDAEGWFMMGRTMMVLQDYPKAVEAFEQTHRLTDQEPNVMLALADALAMNNNGSMAGRSTELVMAVLDKEPQNVTGLWLATMARDEAGEAAEALGYLTRLKPLLADQPDELAQLAEMEQRIRSNAGEAVPPSAESPAPPVAASSESDTPDSTANQSAPIPGKGVKLRVELAPELAAEVQPGDTLFVFARAMQGPRFPVSIARLHASDLPVEVMLDDSGSVMGDIKLSNFQQVKVGARISRSGNAMPQSGDIQGEVLDVTVGGDETVLVRLESRIP